MNLDRRLLKYLFHQKANFALTLIFSLLAAGAIIWQARLLSQIINAVFLNNRDVSFVLPLLGLYGGLALIRASSTWGASSAAIHIAANVKSDIRAKLTARILQLGPAYVQRQQTGELKNVLDAGVDSLDAYFREYLPQLLLAALIPILILIFVFPLDLLSGFVFLFTAPLIPLFMVLIGDVAQALTKKQWTLLSKMNAFFLDVLQGLTMLKILGRSQDFASKVRRVTEEFRHTTIKVLRVAFLSALVLEMLATISTAIIAVEVGLRLLYGRMGFEHALFILILAPEFYHPLRQLGARFHAGMEGFAASRRIFQVLQLEPPKEMGFYPPPKSVATITFTNICFRYPEARRDAISHISLVLKKGQKAALVGPSGSGKSTLVSLLLRFLEPMAGAIDIEGVPLQKIKRELWREQIAWLPQRPYMFHDSVLENVRLAKTEASVREVESALQRAYALDFVQRLPKGLDTIIGERGARLSGGQIQRLALARAFLRNAAVFIFDEPTSHLDTESESLVQKAIEELSSDRIVIAIAHRLYTVQTSDVIFVLKEGELVGFGSHEALQENNNVYQRLLEAQEITL